MEKRSLVVLLCVVVAVVVIAAATSLWLQKGGNGSALPLDSIRLPPGFRIEVYTADVPGARSMTPGPEGIIFVGTRGEGKVYAVIDQDGDQEPDVVETIAEGLFLPNGVAYRDGSLYVAEVNRVIRFDDIADRITNPPEPVVIRDDFPDDATHGWKFIAFGPDGMLYVPVGAPCNVCVRPDPYATILRMNTDGSGLEVFASGVRNTVGFDWDPRTGELWFTDNGRDWMGDDLPPDELNHAAVQGMHFGFPYCHGQGIPDPDLTTDGSCEEFTPAAQPLPAHVAALGMRFYDGKMFPEEYQGQIFIAEHGSWNRVVPTGYRLSMVRLENGAPVSYEIFAEGWLTGGLSWGRPVDVLVMPDGALLVSDDRAGAIYRITYG
jgi:glucose/arabinose dehydrogenase